MIKIKLRTANAIEKPNKIYNRIEKWKDRNQKQKAMYKLPLEKRFYYTFIINPP